MFPHHDPEGLKEKARPALATHWDDLTSRNKFIVIQKRIEDTSWTVVGSWGFRFVIYEKCLKIFLYALLTMETDRVGKFLISSRLFAAARLKLFLIPAFFFKAREDLFFLGLFLY